MVDLATAQRAQVLLGAQAAWVDLCTVSGTSLNRRLFLLLLKIIMASLGGAKSTYTDLQ